MSNGEKKKDQKTVIIKATDKDVVKYSTIKRMLNTLDRFLTKRYMLIVAFCSAVISICTIALVLTNASISHAVSAGEAGNSGGGGEYNVILWSLIAAFGFIGLFTCFYVWKRIGKRA